MCFTSSTRTYWFGWRCVSKLRNSSRSGLLLRWPRVLGSERARKWVPLEFVGIFWVLEPQLTISSRNYEFGWCISECRKSSRFGSCYQSNGRIFEVTLSPRKWGRKWVLLDFFWGGGGFVTAAHKYQHELLIGVVHKRMSEELEVRELRSMEWRFLSRWLRLLGSK